ncbi:hypothetical protein [Paracoccus pacificus]|uniref:Uncharacterized protein n=1 Tax=Paracoccus pacificus TaxID=1463598 RepID=A0ABW4R829_9RHOB
MDVKKKVIIGATALTLIGGIALAGSQAMSRPDIRAYSAIADVPVAQVIGMAAGEIPLPEDPTMQPYCETYSALGASLDHDFGEELIQMQTVNAGGQAELWGSDVMGTWTIVYARPDDTACVVASGTGYRSGIDSGAFLDAAGIERPSGNGAAAV